MTSAERGGRRGARGRRLQIDNVPAARRLRQEQTRSEALLWSELRAFKLEGLKFRRQHPIGRFVVDFYCDDYRLAIEIDGGVHLDPEQRLLDRERQSLLEENSIAFLRISADDVERELSEVIDRIRTAVSLRGSFSSSARSAIPPHPQRRERGPGGEDPCALPG